MLRRGACNGTGRRAYEAGYHRRAKGARGAAGGAGGGRRICVADAVVIEQLRKTFGPKVAVEGMDLVVPAGSLYGFIGPNGAGKTTTIRMIMSILFPDSGRLSVLGKASAIESKDRIGYLPEERGVYRKMKVGSFLKHMARLKGVDGRGLEEKVKGWLDRLGLADCYKKKCEELSKGMQQKVQFIACVVHEPELLILDEPFSGLDPVNTRLLRDLFLEQHAAGRTIIFSTHVMPQAEQICDHIVMIHRGRKVLDASIGEIRSRYDPHTLVVEPLDAGSEERIAGVPGVIRVARLERGFEVSLAPGGEPHAMIREIVARVPVIRVELRRPTLEDVFIQIVQESGEPGAGTAAGLREPAEHGAMA